MSDTPLLSICIPIYNRVEYLQRMLNRFLEDKELFEDEICLYISDNCSQDDLESCCNKFRTKGLRLDYHRNEENIGPDRNFEQCFHSGKGKYTWLLGSDDIPVRGFLRKLVSQLKQNDYGLFHLSMKPQNSSLIEFHDSNKMAVAVNYWITFMSTNIIRTATIRHVDLSNYRQSNMIQVPAFLNACVVSSINAISYLGSPFEENSESMNNGGYNLFKVFVVNLFGIYEEFVGRTLLDRKAFDDIKKIEFKEFLSGYIVRLLMVNSNKNFDCNDGWSILFKYYGHSFYVYPYMGKTIIQIFFNRMRMTVISLFERFKLFF